MAGMIKLNESEKNILILEEEVLRKLISQYQSALNALKVEELTLTNRLGRSQDRVRLSRANTPISTSTNPSSILGNLPVFNSQINSLSSDAYRLLVNQSTLNLDTSPSIPNMIASYDEEEEDI